MTGEGTHTYGEAEEYFSSRCGSCGREATVTRESAIGELCEPCVRMWQQIGALAFCNCPALWGRHSLSCTLRIREQAT